MAQIQNAKKWQYLKLLAETEKLPHALLVSGVLPEELVLKIFNRDIKKVHPDFLLVEPEDSEIKISQIRDLSWRLSLKPSIESFKAVVINKAHLMNQEAQGALLKTLEEPKGKSFLFLITEYPDALFSTIVSRVQRVRFFKEAIVKQEDYTDIESLTKKDLASRFQYAERISKSGDLAEILTVWLNYFRKDVIKNKNALWQIQNTIFLISKTNVNPRLALENLMLSF